MQVLRTYSDTQIGKTFIDANVCIISVLQTVSLLIQDIVQSTTQWGR